MCFLADAMLGALARWLRTLGYDTIYDASMDDYALVRLARSEKRLLLTRDTHLLRRRNLSVLLIRSEHWREQVRQIIEEVDVPPPNPYSRCLLCNELLIDLRRSEAWGLVPPYIFISRDHFRLCPACNQVFWRGSHWERMNQTVSGFVELWRHSKAYKR